MTERSEKKPSWLRRGLLVALGLAAGLVAAEGMFRLRDEGAFPHLNVYQPDDKLGVRLRPGATQKTRVAPNPVCDVRINDAGLRGGPLPPPSPDNVLVVGDSLAFGLGVQENETFSAKLEDALKGRRVINAGIPTHGPLEYNATAEEWLPKTGAKTLIYTITIANDLFEAARPNTERHEVWDGWAVRAPTAPLEVTSFPGREWLFRESHAFFHARRVWYEARHPQLEDAAFETDGTWKDLVREAEAQAERHAERERERARRAMSYGSEVSYAQKRFDLAELRLIKTLYDEFTGNDGEKSVLINLAHATPGDIVAPAPGEEAPPVKASVEQIRRGAEFRIALEKKLRDLASQKANAKQTIEGFDAAKQSLLAVQAEALKVARKSGPIAKRIEEAKAIADRFGAALTVVVLPIDVEVSAEEWNKYGASPVDVAPLKVLRDDIVEIARELGARSVDATDALRAAEPGAFLDRDLHMTPKGHAAVAEAIAKTLAAPPPSTYDPALPLGRSWLPTEEEFVHHKEMTVTGSSAAGCETKKVREWLRLRCRQVGVVGPRPKGARVVSGGHGDALISLHGDVLTMLVPILPGDTLEAELYWQGEARTLRIEWPEKDMPIWRDGRHISDARPAGDPPEVPDAAAVAKICACQEKLRGPGSCNALIASPEPACVAAYGDDCEKLLACAAGHPLAMPTCAAGEVNVGALRRCRARCEEGACREGRCVAEHGVKVCVP
ncbi:alginate O-acetyltransferase AlgX-related protein [Polyangium aurulentum]|uniref:alginate O-acetyltransferase AlgX-related protein n=1 Tax=Polyangium aurulentum TaxID=2567896 RepID=UPI0010ADCBF9|nr:hypothetical protein [Polyangium aurulentum]UQA57671.1 hypothetical protein E8A73_041385 [Polyangium aurulentum]